VELEPGKRRIDPPERHQLRGDPIVKNVSLGDILTLEQDLAALAPPPACFPAKASNAIN
jgi:hypothetical protein